MTSDATHMALEIAETPDAVARLLSLEGGRLQAVGERLRSLDPAVIVTGARGSSDHAVAYFKYLVEIELGVPVASIGPSVASIYRSPLRLRDAVLVSVSQSGQSPDIVALQEAAREAGAFSIAVVNDTGSSLARDADAVIALHAGVEHSVAATKSCITSAVALAAIVAAWRGSAALGSAVRTLPAAFKSAQRCDWSDALPAFTDAGSAYVLGRGPALPVAAEAALKLKETGALHAEAFSSAEVMHGPLQLLQPGFPVMAFMPRDAAQAAMETSIDRLAAAGGRVFRVSSDPSHSRVLPVVETGHTALDPLSMLLSFYGFAEKLSRARGFDPDRPSLLSKVTKTV